MKLLFMTQLALNSKASNTTMMSSFFANFERKTNFFERKFSHVSAQSTIEKAATFKKIHGNIVQMQEKSAKFQNRKRKTMSQLKKRDKVYLLIQNLKTKRVNKKLDHIKIESFFIKKQKESINYELNLSSNIKIHSIFHVSLLKSADSKTFIQDTFHFQYEEENENEIEKILTQNDQRYFIKSKKYFISKNTWEPIDYFKNCQELFREFRQRQIDWVKTTSQRKTRQK